MPSSGCALNIEKCYFLHVLHSRKGFGCLTAGKVNQCICNLGLLFHAGHYNIWLHSSCPRTKSRTLGRESRTGQFDYLTCYFNWHRVQWLQQLNRSTACQAYCILHTPSLICGSRSGMIAVAILMSHLWRRPAFLPPMCLLFFLAYQFSTSSSSDTYHVVSHSFHTSALPMS